jgi:hypothetical protein
MVIDRSEVSRALAKAIAFKQCGKDAEATQWARELVRLLGCADILARVGIIETMVSQYAADKARADS